jgi:hypothetical protein
MAAKTTMKATSTKAPKTSKVKAKKVDETPKANPDKARSPLVRAIFATLTRTEWTSRDALVKAVGHHVPKAAALKVYAQRVHQGEPERVAVARGRMVQVMLTCITLKQAEKIQDRGRGETKEYRLA